MSEDENIPEGLVLDPIHLMEGDAPLITVVPNVDYIVTEDPTDVENEESWACIIQTGQFADWVVRFPEVSMENGAMEFTYQVIFHPELPDGYELVDVEIANYMGAIIHSVVQTLHEKGDGQIYFDESTGEKIDI